MESHADSIDRYLHWIPDWLASLISFGLALFLALAIQRILYRTIVRLAAERDLFWRSLVARMHGLFRLGATILGLLAAAEIAPLTESQALIIRNVLSLALVSLVAWGVHIGINIWMTLYLRRFKLDAPDNLLARKHVTQTRIFRRILSTLILIVATSVGLMTFESVRQYGVSLLASAGAAGLIVGLALQPVLKNLFAGVQLAITQPIRIDDALLIEGEWGNVEEITSTYVVVRIWDWRRLIVPISYFLEKPFQNWTREGAALIGTVTIYLDYATPIELLRTKAQEIAEGSPLWDHKVFALQVTDFKEYTMQVRILVGAFSAGAAFDLRCEMREKIISFLQHQYPESLPRRRATVSLGNGDDNQSAGFGGGS